MFPPRAVSTMTQQSCKGFHSELLLGVQPPGDVLGRRTDFSDANEAADPQPIDQQGVRMHPSTVTSYAHPACTLATQAQ